MLSLPLPGTGSIQMRAGTPELYNSILPSGVHESGLTVAWLGPEPNRLCVARFT